MDGMAGRERMEKERRYGHDKLSYIVIRPQLNHVSGLVLFPISISAIVLTLLSLLL